MTKLNTILVYQAAAANYDAFAKAEARGQRLELTQGLFLEDAEALQGADTTATLEAVFEVGNAGVERFDAKAGWVVERAMPRLLRSLSVGDVVALVDADGAEGHWLCAGSGWVQVKVEERRDANHKAYILVRAA